MGNEVSDVSKAVERAKQISQQSTTSIKQESNVILEGFLWKYPGTMKMKRKLRRIVLIQEQSKHFLVTYMTNSNVNFEEKIPLDHFSCNFIKKETYNSITVGKDHKFTITLSPNEYVFYSDNLSLIEQWYDTIKNACCACQKCSYIVDYSDDSDDGTHNTDASNDIDDVIHDDMNNTNFDDVNTDYGNIDGNINDGNVDDGYFNDSKIDDAKIDDISIDNHHGISTKIGLYYHDNKLIGEYNLNEIELTVEEYLNIIFTSCIIDYSKTDILNSINNASNVYNIDNIINFDRYEMVCQLNNDDQFYGLKKDTPMSAIVKKHPKISCLKIMERNYMNISNKQAINETNKLTIMSQRLNNVFKHQTITMIESMDDYKDSIPQLFSPDKDTYTKYKGNYIELLMNELTQNNYQYIISLLKNILHIKLNCDTYKKYGKCINEGELFALILYTHTECGVDMLKCHLNNDYNTWKWFNYCLHYGINKLSFWEQNNYTIYTSIQNLKTSHIQDYEIYGYFASFVSCTLNKPPTKNIIKCNKFDFICCDVSWISNKPNEGELIITYIDNNPLWKASPTNGIISIQKDIIISNNNNSNNDNDMNQYIIGNIDDYDIHNNDGNSTDNSNESSNN